MDYCLMNESHVAQIAELEKICFSDPWTEEAIGTELDNPLSCWVVALDGSTLVGYVGSQSVLGWADMMNLAVNPDYRRIGVGEKLVHELTTHLKEQKGKIKYIEIL